MKKRDDFNDSYDETEEFDIEDIEESGDEPADTDDTDVEADSETENGSEAEADSDAVAVAEGDDADYGEEDFDDSADGDDVDTDDNGGDGMGNVEPGKRRMSKAGKIGWIVFGVILLFALWVIATPSGRKVSLGFVAKFITKNVGANLPDEDMNPVNTGNTGSSSSNTSGEEDPDGIVYEDEITGNLQYDANGEVIVLDENGNIVEKSKEPRSEEYVRTYLIFGLEEINGAANSDAMMLVSINTKDNTIKMTSLLRDTYVQIPGWESNKLNSVYARGAKGASTTKEARNNGAALLMRVIEDTYDVDISGYACVNFKSFEKIIDRLGGLDIELGAAEAKYLNTTNYISNPDNRCVKEGKNHLNGNQVMGYVRVRKVETLGGSNNDYGRTVRQRRVINAIIAKYKSAGISEMIKIMKDCLGYLSTNVSEEQITEALEMVIANGIYTTKSMRLPTDELFSDSGIEGIFNGKRNITYALYMDEEQYKQNLKKFHEFLFLDEE